MYLLDTHAIIWYVSGNEELSPTARKIMETKRCFFSFVSLWEIAIKQTKGSLQFDIDIPRLKSVLENDLTIVTTDSKIPSYKVKTIW